MRQINILIFTAVALLFFSCKKKADPSSEELGYSYFPINEGDYSIYSVVDTSFNGVGIFDTSTYLIKEEIVEPITVNDEVRYQVYVYYKKNGEAWKTYPDSVWTEFNTNGKIIRIQNNIRFVVLVFPLKINTAWDGNISDPTNDPQNYYEMKEVRRPYSYDAFYYPKTVSVVQFDNNSALDDNYSVEVYADEKGLVYKEVKIYKYDQKNLLAKNIELGRHYIQKLIEHGRYK